MEPAAKTPLLHHKLEQLFTAEDLIPGSHDYKAVVALFESFPKDELFQASAEELRRLVVGLLQLENHGGIRVLIRRDLYGRNVSVVVALPRDRFNADFASACRPCSSSDSTGRRSTTTCPSARPSRPGSSSRSTWPPACRSPRSVRGARTRGRAARADMGRRPSRRVSQRVGPTVPRLLDEYAPRFPDYYKSTTTGPLVVDDVLMLDGSRPAPKGSSSGSGTSRRANV